MSQTRISRLFEGLKTRGRTGLIAYITAGDPSPEQTPELVAALERGGCDLIELGVPFSDPIADGPVIQRGSERALRAGTNLHTVLDIARRIRETSEIPILLFTYMNPVMHYGFDALGADARSAGVDGCLLTDLSVEEAGPYVAAMQKHGLDTVFLGAPTSTPRRLELVAKYSSGFIYLVSRTGVTGERATLSDTVGPLVEAMRAQTDLPLAVGFGVSTADHVRAIGGMVEAVAVGSAFVRTVECHAQAPAPALEALARELASGLPSKER